MRYWTIFVGKLAILASIDGLRAQNFSFSENRFANGVDPDMVCFKDTTDKNLESVIKEEGRKLAKEGWIVAVDVPELSLKFKM